MNRLRWVVVALAVIEGGWLAFDGGHALVTGNYVTPSTGRFAGQLGPWSDVVSAVGIEPRSTLMTTIHLVLGGAWLIAIAGFVRRRRWSRWAMVACALGALWYLPFGTLLSTVQLGLLSLRGVRAS